MISPLRKSFGVLGLLALAAVVLIGSGSGESPEVQASEPESLHEFFDRLAREQRALSPQAMSAAALGTPEEAHYLGRLDIPSVAATEAELAMARRHRAELDAFERKDLSDSDLLSVDILAWLLDQRIAGADFIWHDFPVNQLMAIHNLLPGYMTAQHPLRSDRDVDFYVERLSQFPAAFQGNIDVVRHRAERGLLPPRFALEKTIRDSRAFIAGDAVHNPLVSELLARADRTGVLSAERREGLEAELAAAVEQHVVPAYQALIDALESLLPEAESNDGVWRMPQGEAFYRWVLRGHTTTDLGPEEIHQLGLREVERIEAEMDEILCGQGYCEGSVGDRMAALNADPRFLFEDSDAGREAILAAYREIVAEIEQGLDDWFHDGPAYAVEVQRVPVYREATSFGAYYMRGLPDGSRPGVFFANLRSVDEHPRFGLRTLAYHEAIPGHHLQISRMQVMADVPDFRRTVSLHSHAEGWALYAERLAWEMGFLEDPYDNLGRLQAELFRAVRLVVDTGMHHKRWSRERSIEYMRSVTGMPMSDVEAEIERYLVIPGQACSFKIGMMRMQAMRERAEQALGEKFDIRDFHRVILDSGAMPLELLDRVVDDWIAAGGGH
ncbi:MAG: DUF885 domain-containing protein [Wenzhouxiangella sp.]